MAVLCEVCNECDSKYKCSTCFCPYCSVNCWKTHKNEGTCTPKKPTETEAQEANSEITTNKYFTEDTVSEEKLRLLGESEKLQTILNNTYLQQTLSAVDKASNPEEAIRQAMKNPEFAEFVDECLKIVEVPDN